jgi:23S rRNA (cytosine1962-C5)-methyltransferase
VVAGGMPIQLARAAAVAVRRGHPWVYREGILRPPPGLATGAAVEVAGEAGEILGRGLWDGASPIAVRVFGGARGEALDAAGIASRIERAMAWRDAWFGGDGQTTAYRLVAGEGDRVPGFVLDRYGDLAVARLDTEALRPHLDGIARALEAPLAARGIRTLALRLDEPGAGGRKLASLRGPPPPDRIVVRELGMAMEVDLAHGQKTGAFLDQRENRARVRALARGRRRILNLFSYAGGFSLAAALGGGAKVTSVDTASAAHASAERSFRQNGLDPAAHAFVTADVFDFLEQARRRGDRFDLAISDPPSFAPSERARPRAMAAYRRLHAAVAAVLADGAVFCASSCSSHVPAEDFLATLDDATLGRGDLCLREMHGQPPDHPTLPAWPEGRYLKFAVLGG